MGTEYESYAITFLEENDYRILERNFHSSYGEIDIIAKKGNVIVFFECKYRSGKGYGDPLLAVDLKKQRKICKTALYYLSKYGYGVDQSCRFDVIGIYGDKTVNHIENAFEFIG